MDDALAQIIEEIRLRRGNLLKIQLVRVDLGQRLDTIREPRALGQRFPSARVVAGAPVDPADSRPFKNLREFAGEVSVLSAQHIPFLDETCLPVADLLSYAVDAPSDGDRRCRDRVVGAGSGQFGGEVAPVLDLLVARRAVAGSSAPARSWSRRV
ncbi:hypothetical protein ACIBL3_46470 [Kribbella sp. NPDC050124]|uniref:hypothetical protein n=1 Tax=Kribbella sp. NPDC050124 TaxID=3364114 RepID=UPI00379309A5